MGHRTNRKSSLFENIAFLALIGVLAGALGGLGVGVITGRTPSAASSTAK
jgi:hypothetical protein